MYIHTLYMQSEREVYKIFTMVLDDIILIRINKMCTRNFHDLEIFIQF